MRSMWLEHTVKSIKSTVVSDSFERLELKFQAYETLIGTFVVFYCKDNIG